VTTIVAGASDFIGAALIIVFARGITVVMKNSYMTDTILHWMENAVAGSSQGAFAILALGAIFVLFMGRFANAILLWSQVLNGFLLPVIMIFVLILVNRRDLMGDQINAKGFNWVAWISTVAMILLTLVVAYSSIRELISHPSS